MLHRYSPPSKKVSELNLKLNKLGYRVPHTDTFTLETEASIRHFQTENGLANDAIVGTRTQRALDQASERTLDQASEIEDIAPIPLLLSVPYFSQRDNLYEPGSTCNITSLAMLMAHKTQAFGINKEHQLEDSLYKELHSEKALTYFKHRYPVLEKQGYDPENVHAMLVWVAKQQGFKPTYSTYSIGDFYKILSNDKPMLVTGNFTGAGHIVTIVGYTCNMDFIVNDPWGDWNTGYKEKDGEHVIYKKEAISEVLKFGEKKIALTLST